MLRSVRGPTFTWAMARRLELSNRPGQLPVEAIWSATTHSPEEDCQGKIEVQPYFVLWCWRLRCWRSFFFSPCAIRAVAQPSRPQHRSRISGRDRARIVHQVRKTGASARSSGKFDSSGMRFMPLMLCRPPWFEPLGLLVPGSGIDGRTIVADEDLSAAVPPRALPPFGKPVVFPSSTSFCRHGSHVSLLDWLGKFPLATRRFSLHRRQTILAIPSDSRARQTRPVVEPAESGFRFLWYSRPAAWRKKWITSRRRRSERSRRDLAPENPAAKCSYVIVWQAINEYTAPPAGPVLPLPQG
jgi:hypothetical protein